MADPPWVVCSTTLPPSVVAELSRFAAAVGLSRSGAIRAAVEQMLQGRSIIVGKGAIEHDKS